MLRSSDSRMFLKHVKSKRSNYKKTKYEVTSPHPQLMISGSKSQSYHNSMNNGYIMDYKTHLNHQEFGSLDMLVSELLVSGTPTGKPGISWVNPHSPAIKSELSFGENWKTMFFRA